MKLKLLCPLTLRVKINDNHTIATSKRFRDPLNLVGNVKAIIGQGTDEELITKLIPDLKPYLEGTNATITDCTLEYSVDKIDDNGRVWASNSIYSSHEFK